MYVITLRSTLHCINYTYVCCASLCSGSKYITAQCTLHTVEPVFTDVVVLYVCIYALLLACAVQEMVSLQVKGSRVEELQAELSSQKERFEETSSAAR